jgi:AraC-like DNA-binding protein
MSTVAASVIADVLQELGSLGIAPEKVCQAVGLDMARLRDRSLRVCRKTYGKVFVEAERLSGDPLVGMHAAEARGARCMLATLAMVQPTLEAGIKQFASFVDVASERLAIRLRRGPEVSTVRVRVDVGDARATAHAAEYLITLLVQLYRDATREPFHVLGVSFPHELRGDQSEYERVLGAPVTREPGDCVITLPNSALQGELRRSNAEVADLLADAARREVAQGENTAFRPKVEDMLFKMYLRSSTDAPQEVARLLAVSSRTLQRRLSEEGTTFRDVRDSVRRRCSSRLLRDGALSVSEVSARVGFSDVAAFDKAFRRWFGETPSGFRGGSLQSVAKQ